MTSAALPQTPSEHEPTIKEVMHKLGLVIVKAWSRASRRKKLLVLLPFGWLAIIVLWDVFIPADYRVPTLKVDYDRSSRLATATAGRYNASKVALLIENRPNPILAPLMLHFMAVVPPDWRFRFMGSEESVAFVNESMAIRQQVSEGKLDLTFIPANMSTGSQEEISRFLTSRWLYEVVLRPAEWLLIYQTDSILCANSDRSLNDFLEYDWVGAPWNPQGRFGGNGGLSLRRVSAILDVLRFQERADGSDPEDVWLTERLGHRKGSKLANGTMSLVFSGEMHAGEKVKILKHNVRRDDNYNHNDNNDDNDDDSRKRRQIPNHPNPLARSNYKPDSGPRQPRQRPAPPQPPQPGAPASLEPDQPPNLDLDFASSLDAVEQGYYVQGVDDWRDGFYEPMGYHTGGSGRFLHREIWGKPEQRKHIWQYCPEVKMTLNMDAAKYVPGNCGSSWKRSVEEMREMEGQGIVYGRDPEKDLGWGSEIIDGEEYPLLPPGLVPF